MQAKIRYVPGTFSPNAQSRKFSNQNNTSEYRTKFDNIGMMLNTLRTTRECQSKLHVCIHVLENQRDGMSCKRHVLCVRVIIHHLNKFWCVIIHIQKLFHVNDSDNMHRTLNTRDGHVVEKWPTRARRTKKSESPNLNCNSNADSRLQFH